MTQVASRPRVKDIVRKLGRCIELVSMDPHFHSITVGLYLKGRVLSVWTYSTHADVESRIEQIRDRLVALGGVETVPGTNNQARLKTDLVLERPLRFLFKEAVERNPAEPAPTGPISIRDTKTKLTFIVQGEDTRGSCVYTVSAEGDAERPEMRIRAVVGGYMRYGDCKRVEWNQFVFPDGGRYDEFARLLLPYARNVSAVDTMLAAADMAGQMTTQTLGFSQQ